MCTQRADAGLLSIRSAWLALHARKAPPLPPLPPAWHASLSTPEHAESEAHASCAAANVT